MTEDFLHYIWKHRLFKSVNLQTTGGEKVSVEHPGTYNTDAGPDFFNARIKIGSTLWAGNVEIHLHSSDWRKHLHQNDKAYDNVILHVVEEHDEELIRKDGTSVHTLELKNRIEKLYLDNYEQLISSRHKILCEKKISMVPGFTVDHWLERMLVERLERKSKDIFLMLKQNKNNWEETFYFLIARNFGFKLNAQPFEELARSLPLSVLAKHRNDLRQVEAMLFGQAGMLGKKFSDGYPSVLKKEFDFLNAKFRFENKVSSQWKFLRLRPANFPTIRITQFAQLIHKSSHLFSKVLDCTTLRQVKKLFDVSVSDYWKSHYTFEKKSKEKEKHLGDTAVENIIINTISPIIFAYGMNRNDEVLKERAMKFLEDMAPEKNSIITKWESIGVEPENSCRSQALLELFNEYCTKKKCLTCGIGSKLISAKS